MAVRLSRHEQGRSAVVHHLLLERMSILGLTESVIEGKGSYNLWQNLKA